MSYPSLLHRVQIGSAEICAAPVPIEVAGRQGWTFIRYNWLVFDDGSVGRPSSVLAASLVSDARKRSGLSQRELASRAGVSRTTVVEIEAGRRVPGLATLRAVLRGAGLDLDMRLVSSDDHDEVLERTLQSLGPGRRVGLERGLDRFVSGLADNLAQGRPLIAGR